MLIAPAATFHIFASLIHQEGSEKDINDNDHALWTIRNIAACVGGRNMSLITHILKPSKPQTYLIP